MARKTKEELPVLVEDIELTETVEADHLGALLNEYMAAREAATIARSAENALKDQLAAETIKLRARRVRIAGHEALIWKANAARLDSASLKRDHPEVYEAYRTAITKPTFTVK